MLSELHSEWIQYILTNMEDAVCLTGMNGELLFANPAAEKLFGLEGQDSVKIWDAIPYVEGNDELIQLFIDGVTQKKRPVRALVEYVNKQGKRFRLQVVLTCESSESGMILIVIHDLTSLTKVHSALKRYTSPEIADFVLTTPEGERQGGQNREVSVLMSDLRGFSAISNRIPCDDLITMLNHYFAEMSAVIRRYSGTVIEFLGDGIFAVFGAPTELPEHAESAVRCAVGMQNAMAEINTWNRAHGYPILEMGIGVSSGTAVVGNIGSDQKMKYGCMGTTVNLAGRMESIAIGGEICITESTRESITCGIDILKEGMILPKGSSEELKYYSISGIGAESRLDPVDRETRRQKLRTPERLCFFLLDGKIVAPKPYEGLLTEVSEDGKFGTLETEKRLHALQNLRLQSGGGEAYCQVKECNENRYLVGFTMKSEAFFQTLQRNLTKNETGEKRE